MKKSIKIVPYYDTPPLLPNLQNFLLPLNCCESRAILILFKLSQITPSLSEKEFFKIQLDKVNVPLRC